METLFAFLKHKLIVLGLLASPKVTSGDALQVPEPKQEVTHSNVKKAEDVPLKGDAAYLAKFMPYKDMIRAEIHNSWPGLTTPQVIPAQIEQETCPSAKSSKCWNSRAELKTSREYGFGWGQVTIAYNKDGTERFNAFKEALKLSPSMSGWTWENRYSARYQLRALVLTNRRNYGSVSWAEPSERIAFTLAAYNGGLGGVLSDRAVCRNTPSCDPTLWFGNVENTSKKAKVAANGYGQSFFAINRSYVKNILYTRQPKYKPYFESLG